MGGKCSYEKEEIRSQSLINQNFKIFDYNEIPINQPRNSIVPKLFPQIFNTTIQEFQAMDVQDQQQIIDNSLISSQDRKIKLSNILEFLKEKNEDSLYIKKSKKKSNKKSRQKRKRITMEYLEQIS